MNCGVFELFLSSKIKLDFDKHWKSRTAFSPPFFFSIFKKRLFVKRLGLLTLFIIEAYDGEDLRLRMWLVVRAGFLSFIFTVEVLWVLLCFHSSAAQAALASLFTRNSRRNYERFRQSKFGRGWYFRFFGLKTAFETLDLNTLFW